MKCPKCKKEMERLMFDNGSVDICIKCKIQVYFNCDNELVIDKFSINKDGLNPEE